MKLGVACLVRNEADIAPVFLRHLAALFDHAVLMDHGSTDGTLELLHAARRPGWSVWRVAVNGFFQSHFMRHAVQFLFASSDIDHVALLDADEFLDVPDRAALEAALRPLAVFPRAVGHLPWRNCAPVRGNRRLGPRSALWVAPSTSPHCKTILPRLLYEASGGRAAPAMGNHAIDGGDGAGVEYRRVGQILHMPVRSVAQLRRKVLCGAAALPPLEPGAGSLVPHWSAMVEAMAERRFDDRAPWQFAASYGEDAMLNQPLPGGPRQAGFTRRRLRSVALAPEQAPRIAAADPLDIVAASLLSRPAATTAPRLRLRGDLLQADTDA